RVESRRAVPGRCRCATNSVNFLLAESQQSGPRNAAEPAPLAGSRKERPTAQLPAAFFFGANRDQLGSKKGAGEAISFHRLQSPSQRIAMAQASGRIFGAVTARREASRHCSESDGRSLRTQ